MEQVAGTEESTSPRQSRSRGHASAATPAGSIVLGPRDSLNGTLIVDADIRVHGSVEGELRASGDVEIEDTASVRARIEGRAVSVRGTVSGSVTARQRLVVAGSATVNGDVRVPRLQVDDGATINGNVSMGPVDEPQLFAPSSESSNGAAEA